MPDGGEVRAFAPATVANLACGFDVLGLALEEPGDEVAARLLDDEGAGGRKSPVLVTSIAGDEGRIPLEADRNGASVAARALVEELGVKVRVGLDLKKGVPLSSGLGGSAASAVAAVVAVDALLGARLPRETLLALAVEGERATSGSAHPDNAAPSLYGGLVLVRSSSGREVINLPLPPDLVVVVVHPHLEVETRAARRLLGDAIPLKDAVHQWGNLAAFVAGLFRADWDMISRSLVDVVAEPRRAPLVPGFAEAKRAAISEGALGCGLAGSGPSLFALCRGRGAALAAGGAMRKAFRDTSALPSDLFLSGPGAPGARILPR